MDTKLKRITPEIEKHAAIRIAMEWIRSGESLLKRDPNVKYIKLSDEVNDKITSLYEDGYELSGFKYNLAANMRIKQQALDTALSVLKVDAGRKEDAKYPNMVKHFNIRPYSF